MPRFLVGLLSAVCVASVAAGQRTRPAPAGSTVDLDAYVTRAMRTFDVPGMAVSIVRNGKVVAARGYGVRQVGDTARVTPQTRFAIGEITRAFTATVITKLADRGTLPLDSPVVRHLPEFGLADPLVTASVTPRDLLLQRSGLAPNAGELLWWPATTYTRTDIARRLRHLPLETGFRSGFSHDNVLYIVAGALIEAVTQAPWEQVITDSLLRKLGMRHTGVRHSDLTQPGNFAKPHALVDGRVASIRTMATDVANPNSGINSSAEDMATWMLAQLNGGRSTDSVQVWRGWAQGQLWRGTTPMRAMEPHDKREMRELGLPAAMIDVMPEFRMYALGAEVRDYRGTRIIMQQGDVSGSASALVYVPSLDLGVSVLTNQQSQDAVNVVVQHLLDEQLGTAPIDWIGLYERTAQMMRSKMAAFEKEFPPMIQLDSALRDTIRPPPRWLFPYTGRYEDPWYGPVRIDISPQGDKLTLQMLATPGMVGDITHWEKDVFTVRWRDRHLLPDAFIWFSYDRRGDVVGARMERMTYDRMESSPSADPFINLRFQKRSF